MTNTNAKPNHLLKNTLIATGAAAAVGTAAAILLSDKKNRDKAKKIGQDLIKKGKEYIKNIDAEDIQRIADTVTDNVADKPKAKTKSK